METKAEDKTRIELRCPVSNKLLGAWRTADPRSYLEAELACRSCKDSYKVTKTTKKPFIVLHSYSASGECIETETLWA